ncbi:MAG TPA: YciI family protein [Chthoniobacterales bacterium]|nr:YciI family protein [Chthoniobacterales bacterium]
MKNFYLRLIIPLVCIFVRSLAAQTPEPAAKPKHFIYVLHLAPRLHDDKAWTPEDKAAVDRHLANFKAAVQSGQLILAGRTRESGDKTFGIAIFEAADEAAALKFMETDPAVVAGVMTAELHPFAVVLERKNP